MSVREKTNTNPAARPVGQTLYQLIRSWTGDAFAEQIGSVRVSENPREKWEGNLGGSLPIGRAVEVKGDGNSSVAQSLSGSCGGEPITLALQS